MSEYLFTYGTLQPGLAPSYIAPSVDKLRAVGEGVVNGLLYDLGDYPGAVLDPVSHHKIFGTVFELPEDANILPALDGYEDFDSDSPESSLFIRQLHPVLLSTGGALACWIYVYNGQPDPSRVLADGKFRGKQSRWNG
jgi:gamma-glutamylcyclotransferase (GGCT)/AIG2-like uncharacterized protein YtfP